MHAIDTNVIVRYLTGDDPRQSKKAKALIGAKSVFVSITVLLETEWVLRGVYGLRPADVVHQLRAFAGLPNVTLEEPSLAATALDRTAQGMDFADALHLAKARSCDAFSTFDRRLIARARKLGGIAVRAP